MMKQNTNHRALARRLERWCGAPMPNILIWVLQAALVIAAIALLVLLGR